MRNYGSQLLGLHGCELVRFRRRSIGSNTSHTPSQTISHQIDHVHSQYQIFTTDPAKWKKPIDLWLFLVLRASINSCSTSSPLIATFGCSTIPMTCNLVEAVHWPKLVKIVRVGFNLQGSGWGGGWRWVMVSEVWGWGERAGWWTVGVEN